MPDAEGGSRRRVAIFNTNFLPYSQTYVYDQLRHHVRYEPEVFCWRTMNRDRFPFIPVHQAGLAYGVTRTSRRFRRRFSNVHFDVVHAHFGTGAIYAAPYAARARLPLVVTFHGYDVSMLWNSRRFHPEFWPFLLHHQSMLRQMALGLCASEELRALLIACGVPAAKLRVHTLGIDLTKLHPLQEKALRKDDFSILSVGRFAEQKGFEYGIEAFAKLLSRWPSARLTLIGDGELEEKLRSLTRELGVQDRVELPGSLAHDQVITHIERADVLLAPSVVARNGERESGLIVAKEASACGIPVVATWHGGIPEIVDHEQTGLLVPERHVEALSAALLRLARDPALRERMGRAARRKMEAEYDIRDQVRRLELCYDDAISESGS